MQTRPEPPPEGRLIADAADRLSLSIREAARRAGISYGRWRQIVMGYQNVSPGEFAVVRAPAKTVARMAQAAGVTPEQMEAEGERPDAAQELREILRQQEDSRAAAPPFTPPARERRLRAFEDSDEPGLQPFLQSVLRDLYTAAGIISAFPPGRDLPGVEELPELERLLDQIPGEQAFPGSPTDPVFWDDVRFSVPERVRLVAKMRHMSAKGSAGQRDRRVSGLAPWRGRGAAGAVSPAGHQAGST